MKQLLLTLLLPVVTLASDYLITIRPVPFSVDTLQVFSFDKEAAPGFYVMAIGKDLPASTFRGEFRVSLRYTFGGETFRVTRTFVPYSEERPKLILARFFTPAGAVPLSVSIEEVPYEPVKELNQ